MSLPLWLYRLLLSAAVNPECDNDEEASVSARSYAVSARYPSRGVLLSSCCADLLSSTEGCL